ncbi:MAG: hypothetical protein U5Q44_07695 [Dehalococcoidia bacterium]|nr:hypothetical protein [Dehalococcoidia bacterium]
MYHDWPTSCSPSAAADGRMTVFLTHDSRPCSTPAPTFPSRRRLATGDPASPTCPRAGRAG